jgi:hypothetical protein
MRNWVMWRQNYRIQTVTAATRASEADNVRFTSVGDVVAVFGAKPEVRDYSGAIHFCHWFETPVGLIIRYLTERYPRQPAAASR